jgi:hypothetical protein
MNAGIHDRQVEEGEMTQHDEWAPRFIIGVVSGKTIDGSFKLDEPKLVLGFSPIYGSFRELSRNKSPFKKENNRRTAAQQKRTELLS